MENYNLTDLQTREVDNEYAKRFISKYHYSKSCSNIVLAVGEWKGMELKNCIIFNYCAGRNMANEVWGGNNNNTIELSRMVSLEPKPKNLESFSIKRALAFLKRKMPNIKIVISYADNTMGHKGYCYQASNFIYIGSFKTTIYMDIQTHEKIHPRSCKALCIENAKYEHKKKVFWLTYDFCKYKGIDKINGLMFRYIMPLNKKAKKILNEYNFNLPYPKDKDLKFEKRIENGKFIEIEKPTFNMNVFKHNYQKYNKSYEQLSLFED